MADRYAVIGNPINHSRSPAIHETFSRQLDDPIEYIAIEGRLCDFPEDADTWRARGGRGLNITAPFKLDACAYADTLQEDAAAAGAVNCLRFDGGVAEGANFDGVGLVRDIVANLGVAVRGKRVLLLGAGGAARGALRPLLRERPAELVIANRTPDRAEALAAGHLGVTGGGYGAILGRHRGGFDVVVNSTSAGWSGTPLPVPPASFGPGCLAYDMVYGAEPTPFMRQAADAGARTADGLGMLVEQAAEAFAWWRGLRPDTEPVIGAMRASLR